MKNKEFKDSFYNLVFNGGVFLMSQRLLSFKSFVLSSLILSGLASQGVAAVSLIESMKAACENNPALKAADEELEAIRARKIKAYSDFLPSVSARIESGKNFQGANRDPEVSSYGQTVGSGRTKRSTLEVNQSLFSGGKGIAGVKQVDAVIRAQEARRLNTLQTLLFDTAKAYVSTWAAEQILMVAQRGVEVYHHHVDITMRKHKLGAETLTEVKRAESELLKSEAQLEDAKAQLKSAISSYERTTGTTYAGVENPALIFAIPETEDEILSRAEIGNPSMREARENIKNAEAGYASSIGSFSPRLDAQGVVSNNRSKGQKIIGSNSPVGSDTYAKSAMLTLTIPLFQKGAEYGDLKETKRTLSAKRLELSDVSWRLKENVQSLYAQWGAAKKKVLQLQENIKASRFLADGVRKEHEAGIKTLYDVLVAEKATLDAENLLVDAKKNQIQTYYQILQIMGDLSEKVLLVNNAG